MTLSRRTFLARSLLGGSFAMAMPFSPLVAATRSGTPWINWSGALQCQPASRFAPANEAELIRFLQRSEGQLRPVGSGHSFSPLVPTDGHIVVLDQLAGLRAHDADAMTTTFGAGTRLGDTGAAMDAVGQAMYNLPDIDRQTIAGAISTATHGTGLKLGGLPDYVTHLRLVTSEGTELEISPQHHPEMFDAARVSLGALGIITEVTFHNRKPYRLKATNEIVPISEALEQFDRNADEYRHHELFPFLYSDYTMALSIEETSEPVDHPPADPEQEQQFMDLMSALLAGPAMLRQPAIDALVSGAEASTIVDHSWKVLSNIRNNRFNEMEYSVPLRNGAACLKEILATVKSQSIDVLFPLEYRYVRHDDTWLGMHSGDEDHAAISIHQMASMDYRPYFDIIEPIFWKYGGRPHWGKVHSLGHAQLRKLYPRFDEFCALRTRLDPGNRLLNDHLRKLFVA